MLVFPHEENEEGGIRMSKVFIGKAALVFLEKNAKKNANKICRNFVYEPDVPKKLKNK